MRDQHPVFGEKLDRDTPVWRYFDLPRFLSLLQNEALYFCRADLLGDPLEGSFTKATVAEREKCILSRPAGMTREEAEAAIHRPREWHCGQFSGSDAPASRSAPFPHWPSIGAIFNAVRRSILRFTNMPRLPPSRHGEPLATSGIVVPFSFWPAKAGKRWKLQRRLYVKDPWATLFEAVYRSNTPKPRVREALSYLDQAEDYFIAGTQIGGRIGVKPVLLYYSVLNLAKCLIAVRQPSLDLSHAYHGLTATRTHKWAILGDEIKVKTSTKNVNIFSEVMTILNGRAPNFTSLECAPHTASNPTCAQTVDLCVR